MLRGTGEGRSFQVGSKNSGRGIARATRLTRARAPRDFIRAGTLEPLNCRLLFKTRDFREKPGVIRAGNVRFCVQFRHIELSGRWQ